jgi:hypothetical protein
MVPLDGLIGDAMMEMLEGLSRLLGKRKACHPVSLRV